MIGFDSKTIEFGWDLRRVGLMGGQGRGELGSGSGGWA